jgi:hypothetical protein
MSENYEDNRVTQEDLAKIKKQAKAAPKNHGLKYFYMNNHYGNLYSDQQAGYHWFYLSSANEAHCTCGLIVSKGSKIETSIGHKNLPSFEGLTTIFISSREFRPSKEVYENGAFCQNCQKGSLRNLSKEEVNRWIENHKEECTPDGTLEDKS